MACVPCQVILWDQRATGMIETASEFMRMKLAGNKIGIPAGWEERWYSLIDQMCPKMESLLNEITGGSSGS